MLLYFQLCCFFCCNLRLHIHVMCFFFVLLLFVYFFFCYSLVSSIHITQRTRTYITTTIIIFSSPYTSHLLFKHLIIFSHFLISMLVLDCLALVFIFFWLLALLVVVSLTIFLSVCVCTSVRFDFSFFLYFVCLLCCCCFFFFYLLNPQYITTYTVLFGIGFFC